MSRSSLPISTFLRSLLAGMLLCSPICLLGNSAAADEKTITITVSTDKKTSDDTDDSAGPFSGKRPTVDVAILLDTSNSMDGLIKQAKTQLWTIVQEFADAKKEGKTPSLRVALFEYGNTKLPVSEGYIRQVVQLTDDLDSVSEALFSLTTRGGDEYCGQVINEALIRLDWSDEPNAYKAIFIAGNEPFTQGPEDYRKVCKKAIEQGVIVNTVHCGSYSQGVQGKWEDGAKLAEGKYLNIDQDEKVKHIVCPQDKIILELNTKLNKTYLWFGRDGVRQRYRENQATQDANAKNLAPAALYNRIVVKGGAGYNNAGRDLVDALAADAEALAKIEEAELPEAVRSLSESKRRAYVQTVAEERKAIQAEIAKLNRERAAYLAKQVSTDNESSTFGSAVTEAVRAQLQDSGFKIGE